MNYEKIEIGDQQAKAWKGEAISLYNFDEDGHLLEQNDFNQHFTITIGGHTKRMRRHYI